MVHNKVFQLYSLFMVFSIVVYYRGLNTVLCAFQ